MVAALAFPSKTPGMNVFLHNPVRTSPPPNARSLGALLHCGRKITPVSTMMPVFSVNLSWQHPALTPVTRRSNQTFPPPILFPSSHWLFSECCGAAAPRVHWLPWLFTKKTTLVLAAQYADSICAVGVLSNLFQPVCLSCLFTEA